MFFEEINKNKQENVFKKKFLICFQKKANIK